MQFWGWFKCIQKNFKLAAIYEKGVLFLVFSFEFDAAFHIQFWDCFNKEKQTNDWRVSHHSQVKYKFTTVMLTLIPYYFTWKLLQDIFISNEFDDFQLQMQEPYMSKTLLPFLTSSVEAAYCWISLSCDM